MKKQTAVVIGATGLIGTHLVQQLLSDDTFTIVRTLSRKQLVFNHQKLQQRIVNFNDLNDFTTKLGEGDIIFSCIGTTQKNVKGNNEEYKKIDHDIPLHAAEAGVLQGFKKFLIVSSVGADATSSNFYLQLKGRIENEIKSLPFESVSIFRPSMLLGKRMEKRRFEKVLQGSIKFISGFMIGALQKYHSIYAKDVAKAMIAESKQENTGIHIFKYKEIMHLIR